MGAVPNTAADALLREIGGAFAFAKVRPLPQLGSLCIMQARQLMAKIETGGRVLGRWVPTQQP